VKKEIRKLMIDKRNKLSKEEVTIRSKRIIEKIMKHDAFIQAETVALFNAFGNEIDLSGLLTLDKIFLYPKIDNNDMNFYIIKSNTEYVKSNYGIMEPKDGKILNDIDLIIVPLLAYNQNKHRIGYGKGYYDRFIHKYNPKHKIGVSFDFQYIDFIEDINDEPLDDIITDKEDNL
jgi:5-formyltetrahydrofolate cyclo-ligase